MRNYTSKITSARKEETAAERLRKIEKQARQLIFKMKRLEEKWRFVRSNMDDSHDDFPRTLGDALSKGKMGSLYRN